MNNIIPQNKFKNFANLANSYIIYKDFGDNRLLGNGVLKVVSYNNFYEAKLYYADFKSYLHRQENDFKQPPSNELKTWQKHIIKKINEIIPPSYSFVDVPGLEISYRSKNELKEHFKEYIIPELRDCFKDKRKRNDIKRGLIIMEKWFKIIKESRKKLRKYKKACEYVNDYWTQKHKQDNLNRSIRRTKNNIKHYLNCINADHLITLTFRGVVTNREYVRKCFKKFLHYVRNGFLWKSRVGGKNEKQTLKLNVDYLAVLERHKSNGYHIHLGINGKQNINYLRLAWYKAVGNFSDDAKNKINGQINVKYIKASNSANKVASYISKYISKDLTENTEKNKRRFWRSKTADKGANKPTINYHFVKIDDKEYVKDNYNFSMHYMNNAMEILNNYYNYTDIKSFNLRPFVVNKIFEKMMNKIGKNKKVRDFTKINSDKIYSYCEDIAFPYEFDNVTFTLLKTGKFEKT